MPEVDTTSRFNELLKTLKLTPKVRSQILMFYLNVLQDEKSNEFAKDPKFESYCNQIIEMIKNNQDLSEDVFKKYLAFVFSRVQSKIKVITIT